MESGGASVSVEGWAAWTLTPYGLSDASGAGSAGLAMWTGAPYTSDGPLAGVDGRGAGAGLL